MKKIAHLLCSIILVFSSLQLAAQDISGIWRGTFYNEYEYLFTGAKYRYEVQITSNGKDLNGFTPMKGVTYSYQNTRFYGKASAVGRWSMGSRDLTLVETKMQDMKIDGGGDGCLMTCYLRYRKEGEREFMEGTYTSVNMKNDTMSCGGGVVRLEKVLDSDFKKEDFLNKKPAAPTPEEVTKPGQTEYLIKKPATTKKPTSTPPNVKTNKPPQPNKGGNTQPSGTTTTVTPPAKPMVEKPAVEKPAPKPATIEKKPEILPAPLALKNRKKELVEEITTSSPTLEISFYDNGEIDGDTISVYANNRLVVSNKGLSAEPITITLKMNVNEPEQELVMVAENLGSIPPNTALMIVQAGAQRYAVRLSSTEQKNAVVRFRYDPNALK